MKTVEAEEKRESAQAKSELEDKRYMHDLAKVVQTAEGKRVFIRLLERAGVFSQVFVPGENDRSYLNEGRRLFGLNMLRDLMRADPENFTLPIMQYKPQE